MKLPRKSILASTVIGFAGSMMMSSIGEAIVIPPYPTSSTARSLAPKNVFSSLSRKDKNTINQAAYILRNYMDDFHLIEGDYQLMWIPQEEFFPEEKVYGIIGVELKYPIPLALVERKDFLYAKYEVMGLFSQERQDILEVSHTTGAHVVSDMPGVLRFEVKDEEANRWFSESIRNLHLAPRTSIYGAGTPLVVSKDAYRKIQSSSSLQEVMNLRMRKMQPYGGLRRDIVEKWKAIEKAPFQTFKPSTPGR